MIGRRYRFRGLGSLQPTYRHGKTVRSQLFLLRYLPNSRRQDSRLAIVVSRKVHKSAVVRNRIRRRLFAQFQDELPKLAQAYDLIVVVFSDRLATIPADELNKAVQAAIRQAHLG